MADSKALSIQEDDVKSITEQLKNLRSTSKGLELQIAHKESEIRRAQEEQALLRELRTINDMTIRKLNDQPSAESNGRLKITEDNLERVCQLEQAIKRENKKTEGLQREAELLNGRIVDMENHLQQVTTLTQRVKAETNYEKEGAGAKGVSYFINEKLEQERLLEQAENVRQSDTLRNERLTDAIEQLTQESAKYDTFDEEMTKVTEELAKKDAEYREITGQNQSVVRIAQKKERLLTQLQGIDDYKTVKLLEGDKKVLHNSLARSVEANAQSSKTILAQEVRIRHLEARLEALNGFLQDVVEADAAEGDEVAETEVTLEKFHEVFGELVASRKAVDSRNQQLDELDAQVEQLERKVSILHCAMVSQTVTHSQGIQDKDREYDTLNSHLMVMADEFEEERYRLNQENDRLREKLGL